MARSEGMDFVSSLVHIPVWPQKVSARVRTRSPPPPEVHASPVLTSCPLTHTLPLLLRFLLSLSGQSLCLHISKVLMPRAAFPGAGETIVRGGLETAAFLCAFPAHVQEFIHCSEPSVCWALCRRYGQYQGK